MTPEFVSSSSESEQDGNRSLSLSESDSSSGQASTSSSSASGSTATASSSSSEESEEPVPKRKKKMKQNQKKRKVAKKSKTKRKAKSKSRRPGTIPAVPRTGHVTDKLKKAIKRGEVINLALLKAKSRKETKNKRYMFDVQSASFKEEELSEDLKFYEWIECFLVFMAIRLEYFPHEAQGLIRDMQNVQMLGKSKKDGVEYDLEFRRVKRQHPTIQWGEYLPELVESLPNPVQKTKVKTKPEMSRWFGVCSRFNGYGCSLKDCKYKHVCKKCKGGHPVRDCKK